MSSVFACKNFVSAAMIPLMARKIFLGIRVDPDLRKALEEIGNSEQRSVSQICEMLLKRGAEAYQRDGSKYLHDTLVRQKRDSPD